MAAEGAPDDDDVAARLAAVRGRVEAACARAGRDPAGVVLVGVSKFQPDALVEAAYRAGLRHFGETYAQDLRDRARRPGLDGARWHAIGPLQTNKARYVARHAHAFHALDRLAAAEALSGRREGPPLRCYVEVNLAGEPTKAGARPDEVPALVAAAAALPGLDVVGLMAMPPLGPDPEASRPWFRRLRALAADAGLPELSMGTTGDFEVAVEEGSTCVRVGRAVFGTR